MRGSERIFGILALLAGLPRVALAQEGRAAEDSALTHAIVRHVDERFAAQAFSGIVLVARNGQVLVEVACGDANQARGYTISPNTRFNVASGDKLFTKIAIGQLLETGKISLSDTVGKFLPDYPNAVIREKATIEHLLRHRSGLGSYWNDAFRQNRSRLKTLADLIPLFADEPLAFAPGAGMAYSNGGYVLLGRIIEVVTSVSYYDYVRTHIFEPAKMRSTGYSTIEEWPADKAVGYTVQDSSTAGAHAPNTWSLAYRGSSAGGGYSTAADLLRLDAALRDGAILQRPTASRLFMRSPEGKRELLANGGGPGANFEFSRFGDYTVIVLSNYDPPAATGVLQYVASLVANRR
jgi:CubicO group peptidase (beta-lactamase class C family)